MVSELYSLLWAKSFPFVSLPDHMMAVGLCGQAYLSAPSSRHVLLYLAGNWHCSEQQVLDRVGYLFSLHDIGKCHPRFQKKDDAIFQKWQEAGYADWFHRIEKPDAFRHEGWSAIVCSDIWSGLGWEGNAIEAFSTVLRIHHQKTSDKTPRPLESVWVDLCHELELQMRDVFHPDALTMPDQTDAVCLLLSALLIVCDWVASSNLLHYDGSMTVSMIRDRLETILYECDIMSDALFPSFDDFSDMFPGIPSPRPLQAACVSLDPSAKLTIIEAPMGEGKTEAALYTANLLCKQSGLRGIYMALPTQATSNQMVQRVNALLSENEMGDARLLHGNAFLYEDPVQFATEDEANAAKWMRPSRMGLLQSNAVGTVDQAMASVLLSKFSIIRLAGLTGKVLIIDEIHAYDMYMSMIIEILLSWCSALDIPVILLSATMQNAQKSRYLKAFGANMDISDMPMDYPLMTQVSSDRMVHYLPVAAAQEYHYGFSTVPVGEDIRPIIDMALSSISDGGCIAVIANTVKRAQQIYEELIRTVDSDVVTVLFHARFPIGKKAEIEKRCVSLFGKDRTLRPARGILVATQVVEQSIDLDFDAMISDLAPIDLILQRAGRLHRHRQYSRPERLIEPVMHVILPSPDDPEDHEKRYGVSGYVYDKFLLFNTEQWLSDNHVIHVPQDIRPVIEKVYTDVTAENADDHLKRELEGQLESGQAQGCSFAYPLSDMFFPAERPVYFDLRDMDDGFDRTQEASTRLIEETVRVAFADEDLFRQAVSGCLSKQEAEQLFLNSVSIRMTKDFRSDQDDVYRVDKGFLSGVFVVNGMSGNQVGEKVLENDPVLGVRWKE